MEVGVVVFLYTWKLKCSSSNHIEPFHAYLWALTPTGKSIVMYMGRNFLFYFFSHSTRGYSGISWYTYRELTFYIAIHIKAFHAYILALTPTSKSAVLYLAGPDGKVYMARAAMFHSPGRWLSMAERVGRSAVGGRLGWFWIFHSVTLGLGPLSLAPERCNGSTRAGGRACRTWTGGHGIGPVTARVMICALSPVATAAAMSVDKLQKSLRVQCSQNNGGAGAGVIVGDCSCSMRETCPFVWRATGMWPSIAEFSSCMCQHKNTARSCCQKHLLPNSHKLLD